MRRTRSARGARRGMISVTAWSVLIGASWEVTYERERYERLAAAGSARGAVVVLLEDEGVVLQEDPRSRSGSYDPPVDAQFRGPTRGDWVWPAAVAALCQVDVWLLSPGDLPVPRIALALATLLASALLLLRRRS